MLAILGLIMAGLAVYANRIINERTRQATADAIAQDIYGVLQFVNADNITATVDGKARTIINPLYQQGSDYAYRSPPEKLTTSNPRGIYNNPIWNIHYYNSRYAEVTGNPGGYSPYISRVYSKQPTDPIVNQREVTVNGGKRYSQPIKWSQSVWGDNWDGDSNNGSQRVYFTDSACSAPYQGAGVFFNQQFLSCHENPILRNNEIAIPRIDFISAQGSLSRGNDSVPVSIDRVDVYISYTPTDGNPTRIEQFVTPLMNAFRVKKIVPNPDAVYLVMRQLPETSNAWTLLNRHTGQPAGQNAVSGELATLNDLPDMLGRLEKGKIYGIRFSFDGKGDYLRADGLNSAEKVCWNTKTGGAGPCLESASENLLVLKQRKKPGEFADLQVRSVILKSSHITTDGVKAEYYTVPQIQYSSFTNTGKLPAYFRNPDKGKTDLCTAENACGLEGPAMEQVIDPAYGAISIPMQTCPDPVNDATGPVILHPRISAAVSSVIAGLRKDNTGEILPPDNNTFSSQEYNFSAAKDISIYRLGGTILQIREVNNEWRISGMVATEDSEPTGHPWQYYNPPWLSVLITTWCSSVPQP